MSIIPLEAVRKAVEWFQEDVHHERLGWFGRSPSSGEIHFYPMPNRSATPGKSAEVDARDIADLVVAQAVALVALIHSHPSGYAMPSAHSGGDYDTFPVHYVKDAFVWSPRTPDKVCRYGSQVGMFEFQALEKAYVYGS